MANKILKLAALAGLGYAGFNALSSSDKAAATKALGFTSVPQNETDFVALIKSTIKSDKELQRLLTGPIGSVGPTGATGATGEKGIDSSIVAEQGAISIKAFNSVAYTDLKSSDSLKRFITLFNETTDYISTIYQLNGQNLEIMRIKADGSIQKIGGGSFTALSDERLKENITPFNSGLEKVLSIETKTFNYKKVKGTQTEFYPDFLIEKKQYGVIAQQLEAVCPEMVTAGEDGFMTVDLSNLSLLLVNAVKELNKKDTDQQKLITSQAAKIKALEDQQALILDRLTALEAK